MKNIRYTYAAPERENTIKELKVAIDPLILKVAMLEYRLLKASSPRKSSLPSTASSRKRPRKKPKRILHPISFSKRLLFSEALC